MSGSGDKASKTGLNDKIKELINDNKVMVFSKTYCKFEFDWKKKLQMNFVFLKVHIVRKQKRFLVNIN